MRAQKRNVNLFVFAMSFLTLMILSISSDAKQAPDCPQGLEAFSQGLHKKLRKDCAYCHGGQGPGPSHSVEDPKASYKMIKSLLNLSSPIKLEGLSESKFITTGGNNHCASMGVECNTSSEELMSLVKPWIAVEIKSCSVATTKLITSEKTSVLTKGKVTLKIPGYDQVQAQAILDTHVASDQGKGYVKIKNLKICHPNAQVTVRGIKILVDGEEDNYATLKERTFEPCNQELNPETLLFSAQNSPTTGQSQIQVSVDSIEVQEISSTCKYSQQYNEVIAPMIQSSCLECHNNNTPLTCDSLINTYQQSGPFNHHAYFLSGRIHPKIGTTLQTELLTQYLKLESTSDNSLVQKFTQAFDKIKNLIHSKKSENIDINSATLITGAISFTTCALFSDGTGKCWGDNYYGQTGNDKTGYSILIQEAQALPFRNIQQIVSGDDYTCAVLEFGQIKCWGLNQLGQTGNDKTDNLILAKDSQALPFSNIQQIVTGRGHTCAVLEFGQIKCWGYNKFGQLGYSDTKNRSQPDVDDVPFFPLLEFFK